MPRTIDFPGLSQTFTGQSKIAATGESQSELDFPELFRKDPCPSAFSVDFCCWPTLRSTKCVNISNRTSCSAAKCYPPCVSFCCYSWYIQLIGTSGANQLGAALQFRLRFGRRQRGHGILQTWVEPIGVRHGSANSFIQYGSLWV